MPAAGVQNSARLWHQLGVKVRKTRKTAPPLDEGSLREMALRYVGRYATTRAKLARYLHRKLQERGWAGKAPADIEALVRRFDEMELVNDRLYGEAKARGLAARGYGPRRVESALFADGVETELRREITDAHDAHTALAAFARRRRFGPYASSAPEREQARRQFAAMVRAGHDIDLVRRLMAAQSPEDFEAM